MANTYTDEQRAEALALYVDHGSAQAGRMLSIPPRTIRYWANQHALTNARLGHLEDARIQLSKQHEVMREELRLRLLEGALDAVDRMSQEQTDYRGKEATKVTLDVPPARDVQALAITTGILIDKYRLESGESTTKAEHSGSIEFVINGVDVSTVK